MTPALAAGPLFAILAQAGAAPVPPYRVGPGDVIEVVVEGRPDLSRMPTVQTTGSVWLPSVGDVEVRGLTTGEIAVRIAKRLASSDLPSPKVEVRVTAYNSQFVWVLGAVHRPGRKPLRAGTRLVDALLDAGGLLQGASGEVVVTRASGSFADGSKQLRVRLSGKDPGVDELERLGLPLAAGDQVSASLQLYVGVSGAVARPGQYAFEEHLTLGGLVDRAGGVRAGSDRVLLRRGGTEREVDLGAVRKGREPDPPLEPGDQVVVRARRP
jgi:polysaccharide biosynthesis/export protein